MRITTLKAMKARIDKGIGCSYFNEDLVTHFLRLAGVRDYWLDLQEDDPRRMRAERQADCANNILLGIHIMSRMERTWPRFVEIKA